MNAPTLSDSETGAKPKVLICITKAMLGIYSPFILKSNNGPMVQLKRRVKRGRKRVRGVGGMPPRSYKGSNTWSRQTFKSRVKADNLACLVLPRKMTVRP